MSRLEQFRWKVVWIMMSEYLKAQISTVGDVNNQTERTHPKVEWDNWNGRTRVKKAGGCETGGRR